MDNQVPGQETDAKKKTDGRHYKHQEFPKAVYKDSLEDCKIINSEEERPEGYVDYDDIVNPQKEKAAKKKSAADKKAAEAAKAADEAKAAYRQGIVDYLTEHEVDFNDDLSTKDLEDLKVQLDAHLAAAETSKDDAK